MPPPSPKSASRARARQRRAALEPGVRAELDRRIGAHLLNWSIEHPCRRLAAYWPVRGEVDLRPALYELAAAGREIYLPCLNGEAPGVMTFRRWAAAPGEAGMTPNRYGIPEPLTGARCPVAGLDLVLVPLLAFSADGARLGSGAGYYDRALAGRSAPPPLIAGVAYGLQEVDQVPQDPWDIPLEAVLTDRGLWHFAAAPHPPQVTGR